MIESPDARAHLMPAGVGSPSNRSRRILLLGAAGVSLHALPGCGGGAGTAGAMLSTVSPGAGPVGVPGAATSLPVVTLNAGVLDADGVRNFALSVQAGTTSWRTGLPARTFGYNGALLGPALRLRRGERTRVRVGNHLDEDTTVHWHGLVVPAEMDGGPHQVIAPGGQWDAGFTVENPASTCWFHPHTHGSTGRQVLMGLAGLLIVDDAAQAAAELPGRWGVDDLALVLQDKRFTASGQIDDTLTASDRLNGYLGDTLLVNGAIAPRWLAPRQWVRLRLLNGCNARFLTLRLGNGMPLLQLANEGGLLAAPVTRLSILLAPGERAEVLVDFSDLESGQDVPLRAATAAAGMGMGGAGAASEVTAMTCRVALPRQLDAIVRPPAALASAPTIVAGAGATVRSFTLGGMMGSALTINGRAFDIGRIDFAVPARQVELWRFSNASGMAHPVHVHGVRMSLLSRGGLPPSAHERGLRDTFVVEPMQTVVVAVETPALPSPVPLMFHCHILEHEDAGMMGQFITVQ